MDRWDEQIVGSAFQINEKDQTLDLYASYTKLLPLPEVDKSNLYRELLGLLYSITHFEPYIRENTFGSLILSDCSALSYLRQIKNHNTRLENVSNYLSSFDNVSFFHISRSSNFLSDSLTHQWSGTQIQIENQLQKSELEKASKINTPDGTIIKPHQIKQLLCEPLDEN